MEQQRLISIKLPLSLIAALERAAHAGEVSPAEVIRAALKASFPSQRGGAGDDAQARADLGAVRAALTEAQGWLDLQGRLRALGYVLRVDGEGLMLCTWPIEAQILPLTVLGTDLPTLAFRFRAPFPGMVPRAIGAAPLFRSKRAGQRSGQPARAPDAA